MTWCRSPSGPHKHGRDPHKSVASVSRWQHGLWRGTNPTTPANNDPPSPVESAWYHESGRWTGGQEHDQIPQVVEMAPTGLYSIQHSDSRMQLLHQQMLDAVGGRGSQENQLVLLLPTTVDPMTAAASSRQSENEYNNGFPPPFRPVKSSLS